MSITVTPPGGVPSMQLPHTEPIAAPAPTRRLRLGGPDGRYRRPGAPRVGFTGREGRRVAEPTLESLRAEARIGGQW